MQYIITATLVIFSIASCMHDHHRTRTVTIEDNHKTVKMEDDSYVMRIKAEISNTREPVDYDTSFDEQGMIDKQKEKLENHILDSLYTIQ